MALNYLLTTPADQNGSSKSLGIYHLPPASISSPVLLLTDVLLFLFYVLGVNDTSMAIDTVPITTDTDVKMESKTEGSAVSDNERTPDKGKKRSLTVSDDDHVARLIGMGFDLDEVTEVLAAHPPGTSFEVLRDDINSRSAHTPKKRKNSGLSLLPRYITSLFSSPQTFSRPHSWRGRKARSTKRTWIYP